jgi:fluoride exporter
MTPWLLVFLGGGIGAAARHGVNLGAARMFGFAFPWGTLIVNIAGSLAMGLLAGWLALKAGAGWSQHTRLFLATGILGGFTTFSAFSLDAALLYQRSEVALAAGYVAASVLLSILGLFVGLALVRAIA